MGSGEGSEMKLLVISMDHQWSSLTTLLEESLGNNDNGMSLRSIGQYQACDVMLDERLTSFLCFTFKQDMSQAAIRQALDGYFNSNIQGIYVFLLLLQGGHYPKEAEAMVKVLQAYLGAELFKFLIVLSMDGDEATGPLDDALLELIDQCDGRFCQISGATAVRDELARLHKMVEHTLSENGGSGFSPDLLSEAKRRNTEEAAMELLQQKLWEAEEQQKAFEEKVRRREESRAREVEEQRRKHAEERGSEAEERRRCETKKGCLEEALRSHTAMVKLQVKLQVNSSCEDETGKISVILLGISGSGKTSTMNVILNRADKHYFATEPIHQVPQPTTRCQKEVVFHGRKHLCLVDTPDMQDEDENEAVNMDLIMDCLALALPGPHVFFLVFQMGRFTQGECELLGQLQKVFGAGFMERALIVFTRSDDNHKCIHDYVAGAPAALQEVIRKCGSRYYLLNVRNLRNALSYAQVKELLSGVEKLVASHGGQPHSTKGFSTEELTDRKRVIEATYY